jgi:predicted permease
MSSLRKLLNVMRRSRMDDELRQELDTHVALIEEEERRQGLAAEQARRKARARFGNPRAYREKALDAVIATWFEHACMDVRFAARVLVRAPGFSAAAVLTMALGIGANAAIFSVVSNVILRPLPYPRSEQLMYLSAQSRALNAQPSLLSMDEYFGLREVNRSFSVIGGFYPGETNITGADRALRVRSAYVDEQLLEALGLPAAHGRLFAPGETYGISNAPPGYGFPPIVILSHELWQTAFGGQPIVGQTIEVGGRPRQVLGIMPPGADVMDNQTAIWLPLGLDRADPRQRVHHMIGRLRDGVTADAAQAELNALNVNWTERFGVTSQMFSPTPSATASGKTNANAGHVLQMKPLHEQSVGAARRPIWMLQLASGFVLLIACANLANLLLARAETRHREFAVRRALGATRVRLLTQAIAEGALLSIIGGALALWIADVGFRTLVQTYPAALPRTSDAGVGLPVLLFTCGIAAVTSIFFGLAQLRHTGARGLGVVLTAPGAKGATGAMRHHVRRGLVVAELALAIVLVIGAALLLRTVYNLTRIDAGFNPSGLVTFSVNLPNRMFSRPESMWQLYRSFLDALRAVPGVEGATAMTGLPLNRPALKNQTRVANAQVPSPTQFEIVDHYQWVMAGYFETMGIPIVRGRGFQPNDAGSSGMVAIVNERFVDQFSKGLDPIGQRLQKCCTDRMPWFTVVGVAKDVKQAGVDRETGTEVYFVLEQTAKLPAPMGNVPSSMNIVLRTALPPAALSQTIERVVREKEPSVPVIRLRAMDTVFTDTIQRPRFLAQLLGVFAAVALLLAAVGTYGVFSYIVAERRAEIGIRMALGAQRRGVLAHVMKEGLLLAGAAVVVGLVSAFALSGLIASLLFGVRPLDVPTAVGVSSTMIIVAALACLLPAWRASRLDPIAALRSN